VDIAVGSRKEADILDIFTGWAHMSGLSSGENAMEDGWNGVDN
jgi:hypothetical protein